MCLKGGPGGSMVFGLGSGLCGLVWTAPDLPETCNLTMDGGYGKGQDISALFAWDAGACRSHGSGASRLL